MSDDAVVSAEHMQWVAEQYAARLSGGDAVGLVELFADDASVEDPVGSAPKVGRDTLLAFYSGAIERAHPAVSVAGPVRAVPAALAAAVPLQSRSHFGGKDVEIDIVDIFTFTADGRIATMTAYFGPSNIRDRA